MSSKSKYKVENVDYFTDLKIRLIASDMTAFGAYHFEDPTSSNVRKLLKRNLPQIPATSPYKIGRDKMLLEFNDIKCPACKNFMNVQVLHSSSIGKWKGKNISVESYRIVCSEHTDVSVHFVIWVPEYMYRKRLKKIKNRATRWIEDNYQKRLVSRLTGQFVW